MNGRDSENRAKGALVEARGGVELGDLSKETTDCDGAGSAHGRGYMSAAGCQLSAGDGRRRPWEKVEQVVKNGTGEEREDGQLSAVGPARRRRPKRARQGRPA